MSGLGFAVIVPTFRRPALLARLLSDLSLQSRLADELWVVDGEGGSPAVRQALTESDWARAGRPSGLIPSTQANLPFQRCLGRAATNCEAVLYLDDDVRLRSRETVGALIGALERGAAAATAPIDLAGELKRKAGPHRWGAAARTAPGSLTASGTRREPLVSPGQSYAPVEWLRGGAMAFRAEALRPESFPVELFELARRGLGLGEDLLLARIARRSGELWLALEASVEHPGDDATRAYSKAPWKHGFARSLSRRFLCPYLRPVPSTADVVRAHVGAISEALLRQEPGCARWVGGYVSGAFANLPRLLSDSEIDWAAERRRSLAGARRFIREAVPA